MKAIEARRQADVYMVKNPSNTPYFDFPDTAGTGNYFYVAPISGFVGRQVPTDASFYMKGVRIQLVLETNGPAFFRVMAGHAQARSVALNALPNMVDDFGNPQLFAVDYGKLLTDYWGVPWLDPDSFQSFNPLTSLEAPTNTSRDAPVLYDRRWNIPAPRYLGAAPDPVMPRRTTIDIFIPVGRRFRKMDETASLANDPHIILTMYCVPKIDEGPRHLPLPEPSGGFIYRVSYCQARYYWNANSGLGSMEDSFRGVPMVHSGIKQYGDQYQQYPTAGQGDGTFNPSSGNSILAKTPAGLAPASVKIEPPVEKPREAREKDDHIVFGGDKKVYVVEGRPIFGPQAERWAGHFKRIRELQEAEERLQGMDIEEATPEPRAQGVTPPASAKKLRSSK